MLSRPSLGFLLLTAFGLWSTARSAQAAGPLVVNNNTNFVVEVCVGYIYGGDSGDFGMSRPNDTFVAKGWWQVNPHSSISIGEVGSNATCYFYAEIKNGTRFNFGSRSANEWIKSDRFATSRMYWSNGQRLGGNGELRWGPNLASRVPQGADPRQYGWVLLPMFEVELNKPVTESRVAKDTYSTSGAGPWRAE